MIVRIVHSDAFGVACVCVCLLGYVQVPVTMSRYIQFLAVFLYIYLVHAGLSDKNYGVLGGRDFR